jgi:predicted DNA-binding transcriptional regulator AlpA
VDEKRLLPDSVVCRRYGVSSMTVWRWDRDPALNFPKPFRIKGRKYRDSGELDEFDQRTRPADDNVRHAEATADGERLDDDDPDAATDGEVA